MLSFVAPVVLEPLFNRFAPLADEELARSLRELSVRAGVPVSEVLVADASRRTRKQNAYVSGFGRTRRLVVFDTLVEDGDPTRCGWCSLTSSATGGRGTSSREPRSVSPGRASSWC